MVAKDLGLDIGNTVTLSDGEKKEKIMISGIYQCGNDLGMNIALNKKGFDKLSSSYNPYMEYRLADKHIISELAQHLKDKYGSKIIILKTTDSLGALDSVVIAVKGFSMVVYLMSIIFVIIVIFLICTKVYAKEQKDYGIYKALGFTSRRIRLQFALRFFFVAVFGSVIGSVLSIILTNPCIGFMFSFLGISSFHGTFTWQGIMQPIIFMSMLFFLFSYLLSYKIKKVEPRILITQ
jgi:ABC-type antimicrobial peptide transport system permease subunit